MGIWQSGGVCDTLRPYQEDAEENQVLWMLCSIQPQGYC